MDSTYHILLVRIPHVYTHVVRLFWLPPLATWLDLHHRTTPAMTNISKVKNLSRKEKPHLRKLLAVPWLSVDVCVWLWLSSSLQWKNRSAQAGAVTVAFRERRVLLQPGSAWRVTPCQKGAARKTSPRNEEAWIGATALELNCFTRKCFGFFLQNLSIVTQLSLVTVYLKQLDFRILKKLLFIDVTHKHATRAPHWFNQHVLYILPC